MADTWRCQKTNKCNKNRKRGFNLKIKSITLKNFRSYSGETTVSFEDLTAFVGRNDIGKSTILEALDIFLMMAKALLNWKK